MNIQPLSARVYVYKSVRTVRVRYMTKINYAQLLRPITKVHKFNT